jgi:hypothetical protein
MKKVLNFFLLSLMAVLFSHSQEQPVDVRNSGGSINRIGRVDLIVLVDTSSRMNGHYREFLEFVSGPFLREFLRIGDTFHILAFSDHPGIELVRRIEGVGDVEIIISRFYLLFPFEGSPNVKEALNYAENYIAALPRRLKKLVLFTAEPEPVQFTRPDTDFYLIQFPLSGPLPSSGRPPRQSSTQTFVAIPSLSLQSPSAQTRPSPAQTARTGEAVAEQPLPAYERQPVAQPPVVTSTSPVQPSSTQTRQPSVQPSVATPPLPAKPSPVQTRQSPAQTARTNEAIPEQAALPPNPALTEDRPKKSLLQSVLAFFKGLRKQNETPVDSPVESASKNEPGEKESPQTQAQQPALQTPAATPPPPSQLLSPQTRQLSIQVGRTEAVLEQPVPPPDTALTKDKPKKSILQSVLAFFKGSGEQNEKLVNSPVESASENEHGERGPFPAQVQQLAVQSPVHALQSSAQTGEAILEQPVLSSDTTLTEGKSKKGILQSLFAFFKGLRKQNEKPVDSPVEPVQKNKSSEKELPLAQARQPSAQTSAAISPFTTVTEKKTWFNPLNLLVIILFVVSVIVFLFFAVRWRFRAIPERYIFCISGRNIASTPNPGIPVKLDTNPMICLEVDHQNRNIGRRNIHTLKAGSTYTVGGKNSDFLIFMVPLPAAIGVLKFDGKDCTFIPKKSRYFPEIPAELVSDCIEKTINVVSDSGYNLSFRFRQYEDPLIALNRIMNSINSNSTKTVSKLSSTNYGGSRGLALQS